MSSPTQRTLAHFRDDGWRIDVAERWNQHARIRQDLFGFMDLVAFKGTDTLAIQATSTGNINSRVKKILGLEAAREWLEAGNFITVIGWKKYAKPVDRKVWRPTFRPVELKEFA